MKREDTLEMTTFERALSDAFEDDPECGAFGNFDDLTRRRMVNDILTLAAETQRKNRANELPGHPVRRVLAMGAAAAVVLGIFGAAVFFGINRSTDTAPLDQPIYFGEVERLSGALFFGENHAAVNAPVPVDKDIQTDEGNASLRLPTGITWQMEAHGRGKIAALTPNRLEVRVSSGESWFRVDPKRRGPAFSVNTPLGRIDVTGTIFVVNADPSEVRVTLLKGEVWITRPDGERELLKAGNVLHVREAVQRPLAEEVHRHMSNRLRDLEWLDETAIAASNTAAETSGTIESSSSSAKDLLRQSREDVVKPDARQLLLEIQTQRRQRNWGKTAMLYNKLIRSAPGSETSIVSRVSLGEIYLTKLNQYKEALAQFDLYLQSGHTALLPEATFGRCNVLKAVGKRESEMRCIEGFLERFSSSFHAKEARARLSTLRETNRL